MHQHEQNWPELEYSAAPLTDPADIDKFLCRPASVVQVKSVKEADHALRLQMILIAIDPNLPNLKEGLEIKIETIRAKHPLPIKPRRGRPGDPTKALGFGPTKIAQWRDHRILSLHGFRLAGHDCSKSRKEIASWMFPDMKNQRKRGLKLDRAIELLDEALVGYRVLHAQTR